MSSLPNDNFLKWIKFNAFADDKLNVAKIMVSVFDRVENILGNGKNAGYQYFLIFTQCFPMAFLPEVVKTLKSGDCVVKS